MYVGSPIGLPDMRGGYRQRRGQTFLCLQTHFTIRQVIHEFRMYRNVTFPDEASDSDSNSHSGSMYQNRKMRRRSNPQDESSGSITGILLCLKIGIGLIFFIVVLFSSVLSKLTLVSLTDALRHRTWYYQSKTPVTKGTDDAIVSLYWQLLLILLVPNCLTFLRCLFFGVLGKTKASYPWPTGKAMLLVSHVLVGRKLTGLSLSFKSKGYTVRYPAPVFQAQV